MDTKVWHTDSLNFSHFLPISLNFSPWFYTFSLGMKSFSQFSQFSLVIPWHVCRDEFAISTERERIGRIGRKWENDSDDKEQKWKHGGEFMAYLLGIKSILKYASDPICVRWRKKKGLNFWPPFYTSRNDRHKRAPKATYTPYILWRS